MAAIHLVLKLQEEWNIILQTGTACMSPHIVLLVQPHLKCKSFCFFMLHVDYKPNRLDVVCTLIFVIKECTFEV